MENMFEHSSLFDKYSRMLLDSKRTFTLDFRREDTVRSIYGPVQNLFFASLHGTCVHCFVTRHSICKSSSLIVVINPSIPSACRRTESTAPQSLDIESEVKLQPGLIDTRKV